MKKLLALILALVLMLGLCACASSNQSVKEAPTDAKGDDAVSVTEKSSDGEREISGDLLVWLPYENHAQAIVKAFNKKYPNVHVEYEIIGTLETAEKLSLDGPSGVGADVIWTGADRFNIEDGYIEPFPEDVQTRIDNAFLSTYQHRICFHLCTI